MANPLCDQNVTSSQNHYSDPMPIIGLYIAGATMVCFVLILSDIISGIRHRKLFPCRYFSLNSATLTLLSVSSKIPVDLTTSMPSAQDQVSKFTGTAILCISMCFFSPSVGAPDSTNNMVALSILVITVVVNICIQMSTGVIFSFIPEHAIIMFFMLVLLCYLWLCSLSTNAYNDTFFDRNKQILTTGKGSLLRRLEACYLHGCNSNPQYVSWTTLNFKYELCFISCSILIITIEVTLRSFVVHKLRFGCGLSDYGWSMWIILATQILVIILGTSATAIRLLVTFTDMRPQFKAGFISAETVCRLTDTLPLLRAEAAFNLIKILVYSLTVMLFLIEVIIFLPKAAFYCTFSFACCLVSEAEQTEEYEDLLHEHHIGMSASMKEKCVEEMKRWKSINGSESPSHLMQLLSRTPPSQPSLEQLNNQFRISLVEFTNQFRLSLEQLHNIGIPLEQLLNNGIPLEHFEQLLHIGIPPEELINNQILIHFKASCLYLVFLARIASFLNRGNLLVESLREVFDIIDFVDTRVNSLEVDRRSKPFVAKYLWRKFFISSASPQVVTGSSQDQPNLARALVIIEESMKAISPYCVRFEVEIFVSFIRSRHHTSTEDLYAYLEQLFIDMLHIFLVQLPKAIFREVSESSVEEYEERVRRMLKFANRVRPLEDKVRWSFPNVASEITSLTTDQTSTPTLDHDNRQVTRVDEGVNCRCCRTLSRRLYKAIICIPFTDSFTKALGTFRFLLLRNKLGVVNRSTLSLSGDISINTIS